MNANCEDSEYSDICAEIARIEHATKIIRRKLESERVNLELKSKTQKLQTEWFEKAAAILENSADPDITTEEALDEAFDEEMREKQWIEVYVGIPDFGEYPKCMNDDCDYRGQESSFWKYSGSMFVSFVDHNTFVCDICPTRYVHAEFDIAEFAQNFKQWRESKP